MSYQQYQNPEQENAQPFQQQPPPVVTSETPGMMQKHYQNTAGHAPPPVVMSQAPYNAFSVRAEKTKKLGIAILTIGIITLLFGIIMIVATPNWWGSEASGGLWSGIFIIIAGSLTMGAGGYANNGCLRIGAMVMCIFALIFATASGILNLIAFSVGVGACNRDCHWDDYYNNYVCNNDCYYNSYDDHKTGSILSLVLCILNLSLVIITLIATINLGRGCCTPSQKGAVIIQQGHPGYGSIIATSTSSTSHQQQGVYPGSTPVYSQHQQHQSPYSQQQQYPSQPYQPQQQYSQAPIQPSGVTYGADYHQQGQQQQPIPQEEQKIQPNAPPPYSGY